MDHNFLMGVFYGFDPVKVDFDHVKSRHLICR